jgi:hypothetical protein
MLTEKVMGWALQRHIDAFFGRVTIWRDVSLSAKFGRGGCAGMWAVKIVSGIEVDVVCVGC